MRRQDLPAYALVIEVGQQHVGILLGEVGGAEHVDGAAPDGDRGGVGQPVRGGEHGPLAAVRPDQHDCAVAVDRGQDLRAVSWAVEVEVVAAGPAMVYSR